VSDEKDEIIETGEDGRFTAAQMSKMSNHLLATMTTAEAKKLAEIAWKLQDALFSTGVIEDRPSKTQDPSISAQMLVSAEWMITQILHAGIQIKKIELARPGFDPKKVH